MIAFLLGHVACSLIGWNNSLLDHHGFRQSQTAITAFYFIKDGFKLAYDTPVFGAPWSVPFEFPLFQGVVAGIVKGTGMGLDQAGRMVNLIFFYGALIVLYQLVRALSGTRTCADLAVVFSLASPVYLFWSRTFLIESMALFFSLLYLLGVAQVLRRRRAGWIVAAAAAGIGAALVKVTTLTLALGLAGVLCLLWWFNRKNECWSRKTLVSLAGMALAFAVIPVMIALKWVAFTDAVKLQNSLAGGLLSQKLTKWNFGTWEQRFLGEFHHVPVWALILVVLAGLGVMVFWARSYRQQCALFLFAFLLGPLVYTNLYRAHGYYWYASAIYLSAALAFFFEGFMTRPVGAWLSSRIFIPGLLVVMIAGYGIRFLPGLLNDPGIQTVSSALLVAEHTRSTGVILCYGLGWDSSIPYYSQRRAIMIEREFDLADDGLIKALENTGEENIQALLVGPFIKKNDIVLKELRSRFSLGRELTSFDKGLQIYVR